MNQDDCNTYDLAIIGGGPAGVAAAISAAKLGKKTIIIEHYKLGGTCLNKGCVPTKSLLKSAEVFAEIKNSAQFGIDANAVKFDFKKVFERTKGVVSKIAAGLNFSLKKSGVEVLLAKAKIAAQNEIEAEVDGVKKSIFAKKILIATGAKPKKLPNISGVCEKILNSEDALNLDVIPQSVTILGAGAIGVEFAQIWSTFGAKVNLVEFKDRILPEADADLSKTLSRIISKQNTQIYTSAKALKCQVCDDCEIETTIELADASQKILKSEYVLCAIGVEANADGLFKEGFDVERNRGFIKIDKNFETSQKNIFACADIVGNKMLAHWAEYEAKCAVSAIFLDKVEQKSALCPACVYSLTPAAWVGISEKEALKNPQNFEITKASFVANAKAQADGKTDGFIKIITASESKKILGAAILGEGACEIISVLTLAISCGLTKKELAGAIFPHPTLSELIKNACQD